MNMMASGTRSLTPGRLAAVAGCLVVGWTAPAQANSVTDWNEVTVRYVAGAPGIPPGRPGPVGFLDVALVQAAVHDAVQAIEGKYAPYAYSGTGVGSKNAAVAAAAHRMLVQLYPAQQGSLDTVYNNYLTGNGLTGNPGLAVGESAAAAVFSQYRPLVATTPFFGGTQPGQWRPTAPGTPMAFLTLAFTEPFTLNTVAQFRPEPPPPMTSMKYVREYNEVKAIGNAATYPNANTALVEFWNSDPLPKWNGALRVISANSDVGESARLLALANLATSDTLMSVFEAKYFYNFWRPVTAIRNDDGNPKTASDAGWNPYIPSPPYPDYPSGMNGVSGAMTETIRLFYGTDDISFSMASGAVVRHYSSLTQAANEVIEVRILHGVHFRSAEEDGAQLGKRIARWTFHKVLGTDRGHDEGVVADWVVEDVKE